MVQVGDSLAMALGGDQAQVLSSDGGDHTLASCVLRANLAGQGIGATVATPQSPTGFFNKACAGIAAAITEPAPQLAPAPVLAPAGPSAGRTV